MAVRADGAPIHPIGTNKPIYLGLYGHPDAGKTRLVCSLPKTLILRPPVEHTESVVNPAPGVEEWMVSSWDEMMDDVLMYLREKGREWNFVWLDSISGWQDVGLDDVWADTVAARPHRKKTPVDRGEYNMNFVHLARFVRACVGANSFNFGFTAWPEELETPTGDTKLMPWIQGKNMANRMVGYMKACYYLESVEQKGKHVRVLRTAEHKDYFTKDQLGLRDNGVMKIVNPTMPKLMDAITEARAVKAAKRPKTKTATRRPRASRTATKATKRTTATTSKKGS